MSHIFPRPSLFVGCIAPEVVQAVKVCGNSIGICASIAQVNSRGGYSGYTQISLREALPHHYLHRDHFGKDSHLSAPGLGDIDWVDELQYDVSAGWNGVHVDTINRELHAAARKSELDLEVGCGEAELDYDVDELWSQFCYDYGGHLVWTSWPVYIINRQLVRRPLRGSYRPLLNTVPRVHNADGGRLGLVSVHNSAGPSSYNIAPELGWLLTRHYISTMTTEEVERWRARVVQSKRWCRWVDDLNLALLAAGHYDLPPDRDIDSGVKLLVTFLNSKLKELQ